MQVQLKPKYIVVFSAVLLVLVLRRPDAVLNPQFWAEDGHVYYPQALIFGPPSIFIPYSGALWILARIGALAATLLPVVWAPFAFNLIAFLLDAACCALLSLPAYRYLIRSDWLRVAVCLLFAATFNAGLEVIGTLTNMPWYLALGAMAAIALQADTLEAMQVRKVMWIAAGGILCAVSSPVVTATAPIAAWRAYGAFKERQWKVLTIQAALLAGVLIQCLTNLVGVQRGGGESHYFPNLPLAMVFPGILASLLGEERARYFAEHAMWGTAIVTLVVLLIWLAVACRRLKATLVLSAVALMLTPVVMAIGARHVVWATPARIINWGGNRYFLLPVCALIFLAAAWLDTLPNFKFSAAMLVLLFSLGIAGNFRVPSYHDFHWARQVFQVRQWMNSGCEASIPIPPDDLWYLDLPDFRERDSDCNGAAWLHVQAASRENAGPTIHIAEWHADRGWTQNGHYPSSHAPTDEVLWGSYSGNDANTGTLMSGPFPTGMAGCIVLPVAHGPSIVGQSLKLFSGDGDKQVGEIRLDKNQGDWQYWMLHFNHGVPSLRIMARDEGSGFGQWLAVGEPHTCK